MNGARSFVSILWRSSCWVKPWRRFKASPWAQWADVAGVQLPQGGKVIRLDSMIAAVRAAERGIGAALVPVPLADLWFKHGSIVRLFSQEFVTDASYYLVWKEDRARDESVCKLRDWILQIFSESD